MGTNDDPDIPIAIMRRIREACAGLPGVVEEEAWVGNRWRVAGRTFAHLVRIENGHPPAYARAAGTRGPVVVLTVRSAAAEHAALVAAGAPFFNPPWSADVIGVALSEDTDWAEVAELVVDSHRLLAPRHLLGGPDPSRE